MKNFVLGLCEYFMMYVGKVLCFTDMAKFCGYVYGKKFDYGKISAMENFCWVCDVGVWKILWLRFWLCENLFVHGNQLLGIFSDM